MSLPGTIVWPRSRVPLEPGQVMLSFDDGPNHHPGTTDRLLDVLEQAGVLASFCVVGRQAARPGAADLQTGALPGQSLPDASLPAVDVLCPLAVRESTSVILCWQTF